MMTPKKLPLQLNVLLFAIYLAGACAEEGDIPASTLNVWSTYKKTQGLVSNEVLSLYQESNGNVWIGTTEGVTKFLDGKFTNYTVTSTQGGLLNNNVNAILSTTFGDIWFGTDGGLSFLKGNQWTNLPRIGGLTYGVWALWQDHNKIVWIGTTNLGLLYYDGKSLYQVFDPACNSCNEVSALFQDSKKNLWVGTGGALKQLPEAKLNSQFKVFTKANGLAGSYITAIAEDAWGSIWVGTYEGKNLTRYTDSKFTQVPFANVFKENWVIGITADHRGSLWITTAVSGLYRYDGAMMRKQLTKIPENYMGPVLHDHSGNIWIGTYGQGLIVYKPS
jgi:ligand-binding sensor domain-containing protein